MHHNILFDTSCGSQNMGDYIICDSIEKEVKSVLKDSFVVKYATHTPISHFYQNLPFNPIYNYCKTAKYKFISGTNLLQYNILRPWPNWNVNLFNYHPYKGTILVGVGIDPNQTKANFYTKSLYRLILNKDYAHSVRDERTKNFLESLGLRAINTGCATTWSLTNSHCAKIPHKKAEKVIFTLTDYQQDREKDQILIDILNAQYKTVYFWVQGARDLQYLHSLTGIQNIQIIPPHLQSYDTFLTNNHVDYIGTRLHAGIRALQHCKRSIILAVDNRARDMKDALQSACLERANIHLLPKIIDNDLDIQLHINTEKIKQWKSQF